MISLFSSEPHYLLLIMETAEGKSVAKESDDGISRNDDSVNLTPSLIPKVFLYLLL